VRKISQGSAARVWVLKAGFKFKAAKTKFEQRFLWDVLLRGAYPELAEEFRIIPRRKKTAMRR
jgi:hypothetical protein